MPPPPLNVAAHLARMAADHPTRPAVHVPRRGVKPDGASDHLTLTFADLNADADAVAHGLAGCGVGRGVRTALLVPPGPDFFALTFALFKVAAVPVLVDPGMGVRNLGRCLSEAEPAAFVAVPKAHLARRLLGWAKRTVRETVNVGRGRFWCRHSLAGLREWGKGRGPYPVPDVTADEPAAVLFTSGSTGPAKGAEYTHGNFAAQVEALKATYRIEPGEVDLCTFPLFALFGPALGMTSVVPDMDATRPARLDPHKAAAQVRQFGVTNLFGSPAVVRRLGELTDPLPTLRRVISAGAPASAAAVERLTKLLPASAEVFTPYGATEALPVANVGSRELLGETRHLTERGKGVCVGRPVAGVEVRILRISDGPIPEWDDTLRVPAGEVGEVVVGGAVVTRRYVNRPEATALAKVRDPRTGAVFHRMGDVGYLDEQGRLWFCGRKAHRVETPHGTLFTDMVEPVFNTASAVSRSALVGVTRDGVTHPVICFEVRPPQPGILEDFVDVAARSQMRALAPVCPQTRHIDTFLCYGAHDSFPVDPRHNSKIGREKLAAWANKKLGRNWRPGAA